MTIYEGIEQGGPQWDALRLGKVTGSRSYDVTGRSTKGQPLAAYDRLLERLAAELATGLNEESKFVSPAMADGVAREPVARSLFSLEHGCPIRQIAFVDHPTIELCGHSPDGLIDHEKAMVEFKCPMVKTHLGYLNEQKVPNNYMAQIVHGFACMPWITHCYFVSYNPDVEIELQMWVKRIDRNDKIVAIHEERVKEFVELLKVRADEIRREVHNAI